MLTRLLHLRIMGPIVRRNHGFIDKYIGDAIMALFDDADDAVRASMEMLQSLDAYNVDHRERHPTPLRIGIGLHRGKLRLGTIGEHDRMDGTVISEAVNLASRIEGLTRFYGVACLISESTFRALNEAERYPLRHVDMVRVRGKTAPVGIYEMFGGDAPEEQARKRGIQKRFDEAAAPCRVKEFEKAGALFEALPEEHPADLISRSYRERCERYLRDGVEAGWGGSLDLEFK